MTESELKLLHLGFALFGEGLLNSLIQKMTHFNVIKGTNISQVSLCREILVGGCKQQRVVVIMLFS